MSRIGKKIIALPKGVTIDQRGSNVTVKGPKGTLSQELPEGISAKVENEEITFTRTTDEPRQRALHGLSRALIHNMVVGGTDGFMKPLTEVGVGYKH